MEPALDRFRSSTSGWLRGTLAGWGTILLAVGGTIAAVAGVSPYLYALPVISLVIVAVIWVRNLAATFEVCEERLLIRRGIFFKSIDEIELYRIKDVSLAFTLINQWADIGTLTISSSDETTRDGDLVIRHVARARSRREELRRLVETARQKRQVREIDMAHDHGSL